jgi:hypothetical protein
MKNEFAVVITTNLEILVEPMPSDDDSLEFLQGKVGGWVQAEGLHGNFEGLSIWVNEEGKMNYLPVNILGTVMWEVSYGKGTDIIQGDVVILGDTDEEGRTRGLYDSEVDELLESLKSVSTPFQQRWSLVR